MRPTRKKNRIRAAREAQGLRQIDLCSRARLAPMTLRRAEQFGPSTITARSLSKIAQALGLRPEDLGR
jgi:transcriptional regulator with XRE-family HTH domain